MKILNLIMTAANVAPYTNKSSNAKSNAQENLKGRTHYAEDDTLKFFKARIVSSAADQNGLFLSWWKVSPLITTTPAEVFGLSFLTYLDG